MGETELRAHKTPLYFLFLQLPVNLSLLQIKLKKTNKVQIVLQGSIWPKFQELMFLSLHFVTRTRNKSSLL